MHFKTIIIGSAMLSALTACTATTSIQATQPEVVLQVNKNPAIAIDTSKVRTYNTTSFGQLVFSAKKDGQEDFYGVMPLKFNGGYLAADILFFAPAMFFNLREVYPYYQFDLEKGVVRYKKKTEDGWSIYTPTTEESERAKQYFEQAI